MKTNVLMKIAVVAMAAFGAYAFSGNQNANDLEFFNINEGGVCTMIKAGCSDSGTIDCKISINNSPIIYDLTCNRVIKHVINEVVQWEPINP